jgi:hypothetical protein
MRIPGAGGAGGTGGYREAIASRPPADPLTAAGHAWREKDFRLGPVPTVHRTLKCSPWPR